MPKITTKKKKKRGKRKLRHSKPNREIQWNFWKKGSLKQANWTFLETNRKRSSHRWTIRNQDSMFYRAHLSLFSKSALWQAVNWVTFVSVCVTFWKTSMGAIPRSPFPGERKRRLGKPPRCFQGIPSECTDGPGVGLNSQRKCQPAAFSQVRVKGRRKPPRTWPTKRPTEERWKHSPGPPRPFGWTSSPLNRLGKEIITKKMWLQLLCHTLTCTFSQH